jgi:hypothetical protein
LMEKALTVHLQCIGLLVAPVVDGAV